MQSLLTLAARNDSTGVAHAATGRSSAASDEANDGLRLRAGKVVLLEILRRILLHRAANLTDDNNTCSGR
jgi:hypothetical protein